MKIAVALFAGPVCLVLAASLADARSLPDWDVEHQCNAMSTEDNVADDPLFKACIEREQKALEAIKAKMADIPDGQWDQCIELGNLQKS